jgi:hypothetical protein
MVSKEQLKCARILLGWSRAGTLIKAGISMHCLGSLEREGPPGASAKALSRLVASFESNGVRFLDDSGVTVQRDRGHDAHRARQAGLTTAEQTAA